MARISNPRAENSASSHCYITNGDARALWPGLLEFRFSFIDTCTDTRYGILVLKTFRHKGLKRLFEDDDASGLRADQVKRLKDVLANLDEAHTPSDLDLPGYRLHALRGKLKGYGSVTISGNSRVIFRFVGGDAVDVDLVDYH